MKRLKKYLKDCLIVTFGTIAFGGLMGAGIAIGMMIVEFCTAKM